MSLRSEIATLFARHAFALTNSTDFQALESGQAAPEDYTRFIGNVVRTHLKLPPLRAFLFTLAPPDITAHLLHSKLGEPGTPEDAGIAHSSLLKRLAAGAGLALRLPELEALAAADIRQMIVDPLRYGTLKEVGRAALCEIIAFEFTLSGVADRIARALAVHHGLSPTTLQWFTHDAEVDIQQAAQGFDTLEAYIHYYEFSAAQALTLIEQTLRENACIKRYFGELSRALRPQRRSHKTGCGDQGTHASALLPPPARTKLRSGLFAIGGQPVPFSGTPLPYCIMAYAPVQFVFRDQQQYPWWDPRV